MNPIQGMLAGTRKGLGSLKVVMATGLYKTAAGVVGARLLKDNNEPLRAYLTIHLRSGKAAQYALAGIEDSVEHGNGDELSRGPSKRAGLFLAAKNLIEYERLFGDGTTDKPLSSVPWEATPPGRPEGWGRALDELRFSLGAEEAELLELHHARGLNIDELAYVLGTSKDEVARKVEACAAYARLLLEDVLDSVPDLELLAKDAFTVLPATPDDMAGVKAAVVPLPHGTIIGERYEIESRIGGGEFAYVYRARDVRVPGHVVALKLLHRVARTQAAREGAIRELSLIASAFHPSLVHFKDHGWFEDRLWFVMPFYDGRMLLERLEEGPLPLGEALAHFERLARALAALHAAGIRHQDIKPENIFLVELRTGAAADKPEVLPVLLDLGVAAPNGEMALAGTPMYFPPEVAARIFDENCPIPLTAKADVFALALSLLHSIEEPDVSELGDGDIDAFLKKRAQKAPPGPRDRRLASLRSRFSRWLAVDPKDRPTAGELADEIALVRAKSAGVGGSRGMTAVVSTLTLAALFLVSATSIDAPARPIGARGTDVPVRIIRAPSSETERLRLLRHRLDAEESRSRRLEQELGRFRVRELGLPQPQPAPVARPEPSAAAPAQEPAVEEEPRPRRRRRSRTAEEPAPVETESVTAESG